MSEVTPEAQQAATALDVAHEVTGLISACLRSVRTVDAGNHPSWTPDAVRDSMEVVEAETRLAVTLESWMGEGMTYTAGQTVMGLRGALSGIHDQLHGRGLE